VVSGVLMPLAKALSTRYNWLFKGIKQTYAVYGLSLLLVSAVGFATGSVKTLNDALPMALAVGFAAMGMHANAKQTSNNDTK